MPTIRSRAPRRKRLNVWLPEPVHDALVKWLSEHDQTIQGTVRRLLEAEIGYKREWRGEDNEVGS